MLYYSGTFMICFQCETQSFYPLTMCLRSFGPKNVLAKVFETKFGVFWNESFDLENQTRWYCQKRFVHHRVQLRRTKEKIPSNSNT